MQVRYFGLAVLAFALGGAASQEPLSGPPDPQAAPQESNPPSMQRPTLGPAPAPSLGGVRTSRIGDARRLLQVRKVFVQQIDNNLSKKLVEALSKAGLFQVVSKRDEADALLRGSCFEARRLRRVHTEVYLTDRGGGKVIWQDVIRKPFNPPPLASVVDATAVEILADLRADLGEAPRRGAD